MATAADFEKAWRLGYLNKDYSLIKTMLHPDYRCFDYRMGLEIDFEAEKSLMETISPFLTLGPWKLLYENDEIYVITVFSRYYESQPRYIATMATAKLIDSKLYRHEIVREVLDYDPAETHGWKWEDYV